MKKLGLIFIAAYLASTPLFANRGISVESKSNRTALVIGNGAYKYSPLRNPVNDANDVALVLKQKGFVVTLLTDATQRQIERAIGRFGRHLRNGGVGLFYYAGHGMQVDGVNYLIPIGANIEAEEDVKFESVNANRVLAKMEAAENGLNMVFLDACRNNPFARSFRSSSKGLAQMDAPNGSFVAFATAPGSVAADGDGRNGLFTGQLIKQVQSSNLPLTQLMMEVRKGVLKASGEKQTPWDVSSLTGDFYFSDDQSNQVQTVAKKNVHSAQPKVKASNSGMEEDMWAIVKDSKEPAEIEIFLESFPNGIYKDQANKKLWELHSDSIESIKVYLKKYPNSLFIKDANKRIWEHYNAFNSSARFEEFIREFPDNPYIGFAKLKLPKMKKAEKQRLKKEKRERIYKQLERCNSLASHDQLEKALECLNLIQSDVLAENYLHDKWQQLDESLKEKRYKQEQALRKKKIDRKLERCNFLLEKGKLYQVKRCIDQIKPDVFAENYLQKEWQQLVAKLKEKEKEKYIFVDKSTGLMWQKGEESSLNWQEAKVYCKGMVLAGYSNWRLPDLEELKAAYYFKHRFSNVNSAPYWSSTSGFFGTKMSVYLDRGEQSQRYKDQRWYVRCVRADY